MKSISLLFLVIIMAHYSFAQNKAKFHSQNYVGILDGEKGSRFQVQTINGFQAGTWFGGIGTGLDYYYFRSVPLFLSINRYFCNCGRSFFLSADAGLNWLWDDNTRNDRNGFRQGDFSPGFYWSGGLGYKVDLKNNRDAILLNVGYSAKHLREKINSPILCFFPPCPETSERFDYRLKRLTLRVGWRF